MSVSMYGTPCVSTLPGSETKWLRPKKPCWRCLCFSKIVLSFLIPGNHQICRLVNQQHSLHCQWDQPVRYHRGDIFENVDYVQVFFLLSSSSYNFAYLRVILFNIAFPPWFLVYLIPKFVTNLRFWVCLWSQIL